MPQLPFTAAPWRYLQDIDLIHIESPKPPRGMAFLVVLGAGRSTYGLAMYPNRAAYDRLLQAGQEGDYADEIAAGLTQVIFESSEEVPAADAALWNEHRLPVAGNQAYPLVMKHLARREVTPPSKRELTFLEGVLRCLPPRASRRSTRVAGGKRSTRTTDR